MEKEAPKRPLTPFFMFREKEKEKGVSLAGAEAGERWRKMNEEDKKPYIDSYKKAREKYDEYLQMQGVPPRTSSKKKDKPTKYRTTRVRTIFGKSKEPKGAEAKIYKGLSKVVEAFVMELGKAISAELKSEERRLVNVDVVAAALEGPKYNFLGAMEGFDDVIKEAEDAAEHEHVKRSLARQKKGEEEEEEKPKKKETEKKRKTTKRMTKSKKEEE